ncbi:MAG: hypothetical protein LC791_12560 [Acidobacteria bacterium]|nr:hypothetical protein [Acidobacteriota bacterium]
MPTALEKIQRLQEQMEEVKGQALEELREKRREAQAQVADIDRQIAELGGSRTGSKAKGTRRSSSELTCPICDIKGHDGRAHRGQGKNKKAFTEKELKERSLPLG